MILLKKYTLLFSLLIIQVGYEYLQACSGWDDTNLQEHYLFAPEVVGDKSVTPFFYTPKLVYYSEDSQFDPDDYKDGNMPEWNAYVKNSIDDDKLSTIIYRLSVNETYNCIQSIKTGKPTTADSIGFDVIRMAHKLGKDNAIDVLTYIWLAKQTESYQPTQDYWYEDDETQLEKSEDSLYALFDSLENRLRITNSAFLKQRYVYQLVRLANYVENHIKAVAFAVQYEKEWKCRKTSIYYRTMGYVAQAHYYTKQYSRANYLYSIIFKDYPFNRYRAMQMFRPQNDSDWQHTLQLAQNNDEKIFLWQMHGVYEENEIKAIKEIYAIDPGSKEIELLLTRAVNKTEVSDQFSNNIRETWDKYYYTPYKYHDKSNYYDEDEPNWFNQLYESFRVIDQIANAQNTRKQELWHLASGYLHMLRGNYTDAHKQFNAIRTKDTLILPQLRLFKILLSIQEQEEITTEFENNLEPALYWLLDKSDNLKWLRKNAAFEFARVLLAIKYIDMYEKNKSESLLSRIYICINKFVEDGHVYEHLLTFIDKPLHSKFEKLLISQYPFSRVEITHMLGTTYLYEYDFEKAIFYYKQSDVEATTYGDPFFIRNIDCHDCDHEMENARKYSQLAFAQRMQQLHQLANTDSKNSAENYFLLANGYYNMTHFGNARILKSGLPYYTSDSYFEDNANSLNYYNCDKAAYYYRMAADATNSREFKARCLFMAAKCALNTTYLGGSEKDKVDLYCKLKRDFTDTKYLKEVLKECSYLRDFKCKIN